MGRLPVAGDLRHQITFECNRGVAIPDPSGSGLPLASPTLLGPFPAKVTPLSGSERLVAQQIQADTSHVVTIRDAPGGLDIRPTDTILWRGERLEIESVVPIDARGFWIEIMAHQTKKGPT